MGSRAPPSCVCGGLRSFLGVSFFLKGSNWEGHVWEAFLLNWPIISSVPDTSAPHFGIHRPKM